MKRILLVSLVCITASCGKSGGGTSNGPSAVFNRMELSQIEEERVKDLSQMNSVEVANQADYLMATQSGTKSLLKLITEKLEQGASVKSLESHIWLMLESTHSNWDDNNKENTISDLNRLASSDKDLESMIGLYLESEGLKELGEASAEEATDPNHKKILERRQILKLQASLTNTKGNPLWIPSENENSLLSIASERLIKKELSQKSLGSPVDKKFESTSKDLPAMVWTGSAFSDWAGTMTINGDYVAGTRFGGTKDWAGSGSNGHAFITPNMTYKNTGDSVIYEVSARSEVKGGGKRKRSGGFSDKCSGASYSIEGNVTIPGCDDLTKCSAFNVLKVSNLNIVSGSSIQIFLNGSVVDTSKEVLVDRTHSENNLKVSITAQKGHCGKHGAIDDTLSATIQLVQDEANLPDTNLDIANLKAPSDFLNINKWIKSYDKGLLRSLMKDNTGLFIFRHVKYLDESLENESLSPEQLSAIKVLNNYIISEGNTRYAPMVFKIVQEKKKTINRLPVEDINKILNEAIGLDIAEIKRRNMNEKIIKVLNRIDKQTLVSAGVDSSALEASTDKKYIMMSLYKTLSDSLSGMSVDLAEDIDRLEVELAQLQHLVVSNKLEVGSNSEVH